MLFDLSFFKIMLGNLFQYELFICSPKYSHGSTISRVLHRDISNELKNLPVISMIVNFRKAEFLAKTAEFFQKAEFFWDLSFFPNVQKKA